MSDEARLETNTAAQRYEFYIGQRMIGLADYRDQGEAISIPHTEIDPEVGGRGLGSRMVRGVLDDLRARHRQVLPDCPFVAKVIREDGSYLDLVPDGSRAAYGLPRAERPTRARPSAAGSDVAEGLDVGAQQVEPTGQLLMAAVDDVDVA
ncbi:MAG: GNAT family N-acetyltransferase [Jatrophihabitans sp.]